MALIFWKDLSQPKETGGLNMRSLRKHNEAFLIKMELNLIAKKDELWVRVLKEKYSMEDGCPSVIAKPVASFVWRSLVKVWDKVNDSISWSLGDRKQVKFWTDIWCLDLGPLYSHRTYNSIVEFDSLTCDMVDSNGEWKWNEFQHLISMDVVDMIGGIPPPSTEAGMDLCVWRWDEMGRFSVSGAYKFITQEHSEQVDDIWAAP